MKEIIVREATVFDVEHCYILWRGLVLEEGLLCDGLPDVFYPGMPPDGLKEWGARYAYLLQLPGCKLFVACEKTLDKPVGYMLTSVGSRDIGEPKQYLQIHELYVAASYRSASPDRPAARLEEAAAAWASQLGLRTVEITCVPAPKQIQRWLNKGFKQTAVRLSRDI